ncbi:Endonuclease, Uma2 family (restriction endonuclease fold) [Halpernia humi]|uniref:Endonuclease, Uma2 family (Restriction endonuclease fold) n=1 Tax=Halpernia humi TaxID=493375 RepID=A0A1H6BA22_9FLAO|nr:Uma2 family endonuclease [Halpernia humi]SEG57394.1 Endonuclease, Uma2 family (restriction endonuclease fold) [Halpernia humi]
MEKFITNINQLDMHKTYSYADYVLWKFQERVELLKGKIFKMSPAPNISHQNISLRLTNIIFSSLQNRKCNLFVAPFDVALINKKKSTSENEIFTVVQPDLCIICDAEKLADGKKCVGAPDLIIEILSPGNSEKEMDIKFDLYEEAGVLEYWIVSPSEKTVLVYALKEGKYIGLKPFSESQTLTSTVFPEIKINLKEVFIKN